MSIQGIPLPNGPGMTYDRWVSIIIEQFALNIPKTQDWRAFADALIISLPQFSIPQQRGFSDWLPWAERCMNEFLS